MEEWVGTQAQMPAEAKAQFERAYADAVEKRGAFHIGVPGGSVATLWFPAFAQAKVDWGKVHVWWVDERVVPPTHADSNYKAAHENWLSKVSPQVHRMQGELPLAQAVEAYEAELARALPAGTLDVALLGVGPDGHVASLFPGHPLLNERARKVLGVEDSPKPPPQRLTVSMSVLFVARELWVVATGAAKAAVVKEAFTVPGSQLPLAMVVRASRMVRLFLDGEAADR
jgi:6-phosphogluconolactonase